MKGIYECSPTQIATYELCPRKWAWRYVDGLEAPKHPSAERGIRIHRHLELWFKKRVPPSGDEARIAQVMIPHLPPPHLVDPQNVERGVGLVLDDVHFNMVIDLVMPDVNPPRVYDHKSTAGFEWAIVPMHMAEDVQASLYAAWAIVSTGKSVVDLQWTYGRTRGAPDALPVRATLTAEQVEPRLVRSLESAREMRAILESGCSAIEVPYDPAGCEAFGGCPYKSKCNLTARDVMEAIMSQGTIKEQFLAKLKDKNKNGAPAAGASPGQVNPPPVANAPQAAPPPQAAGPSRLAQKLAARAAAPAAPAVEQAAPPAVTQEPAVEQAPPAAEEARRGRGRPSGSTSKPAAPSPAEAWAAFAASAAPALMGAFDSTELLADQEMPAQIAEAVGQYADAMLREYQARFEK